MQAVGGRVETAVERDPPFLQALLQRRDVGWQRFTFGEDEQVDRFVPVIEQEIIEPELDVGDRRASTGPSRKSA